MTSLLGTWRSIYRRAKLKVGKVVYPPQPQKVVQSRINGYELLVLANEDVGRQILFGGAYEPLDTAFLLQHIRPNDVCLDIGANIGYYTLLMARNARSGTVHAFEPVPLNRHLLEAAVWLNRASNVVVNECAVGAANGDTSFSVATDGAYSSLIDVGRKSEALSLRTRMVTLDKYLADHSVRRVDIMKVDVEGAELLVLEGGRMLFSIRQIRPRLVLLELSDQNLTKYGSSVPDVVAWMEEFGYQPYFVGRDSRPRPFGEAQRNRFYNVFFLPA